MKKKKLFQKNSFLNLLKSRKTHSIVGIIFFFWSCTPDKHESALVGIYNLSERGDCSREAYIEISLPIPTANIYKKDENHCVVKYYEQSGLFITNKDTIPLLNNPKAKEDALYRSISETVRQNNSIYFLYIQEYQGYSLEELDRELQNKLKDLQKVLYRNEYGVYKELDRKLDFRILYFLDGKKVEKNSKEFSKKMKIDLPPKITD